MKTLFERVAQGEILISDGAMGTFLPNHIPAMAAEGKRLAAKG